jgi:ATP-binding cassette subfamily B protein
MQSAQSAQIHHRIQQFPDGYHSVVGERGLQVSGGERQCIILARTLLQRARILLMDEATSALDNETEKGISQELPKAQSEGTTRVMVAHRLSTIVDADLIVVVADGRNLEQGTHSELLARQNGLYGAMWASQSKQ